MKMLMIGGALAMLGGGVYAYKDQLIVAPNVYAAAPDKIYAILDAMEIPSGPQAPMGTLDITKTQIDGKSITWHGSGSHAAIDCTATLVPLAPDRTRVDTSCTGGGASDGAAAGTVGDILRVAMVEQVDSTLRGRPYDKNKVQMGASMAVLTNMPKMQHDALKMSAEMQQQQAAAEAQAANAPPPSSSSQIVPGQPMNTTGFDPRGIDPKPGTPVQVEPVD